MAMVRLSLCLMAVALFSSSGSLRAQGADILDIGAGATAASGSYAADYLFPGGEAVNTAFHTYGIIWSPNQVQFFVDNPDAPFFTTTPGSLPGGDVWPFNQPIFIVLNEAIGGTLGGPITGLTNPGPIAVDYVLWYSAP
jgi:beta-glucanase (GH16 family)